MPSSGIAELRKRILALGEKRYGWDGAAGLPPREDAMEFAALWACRGLAAVPEEFVEFSVCPETGAVKIKATSPHRSQHCLDVAVLCWGVAGVVESIVDEHGPGQVERLMRLDHISRDEAHSVEGWFGIASLDAAASRLMSP